MSAQLSTSPATATTTPQPIRRHVLGPRPWSAIPFLLTSFPIGLFWFVVIVTMGALGLGLLITLLGIPVLALTYLAWRFAAEGERYRIWLAYGERIPPPYQLHDQRSLWTRTKSVLADRATWLDLAYVLLLFPIGTLELVLVLVAVIVPISLISAPIAVALQPGSAALDLGIYQVDTMPEAMGAAAVGLVVAIPAFLLMVGAARGHVAFTRLLLGANDRSRLVARVETLTQSRSDVVDAMLMERQRIERDLHDGAQQHLVALAMDLGMARAKFDSDREGTRELVVKSHEEAKVILSELRNLIRGIHPAVLTDRGLDAALSAVVSRSPVPIDLRVELPVRPPEAIESAAYFVVVEALTNVAKHSGATAGSVDVRMSGESLMVEIMDNGRGDAAITRGSGLAGLRDRIQALDGQLTIVSPPGGPTRLRAQLPCR